MSRHFFLGLAMAAALVGGIGLAQAADPTIQQVYQQASAGHLAQAQQMMEMVLRDHPNSGKAHFVDAELLARQGNLSSAKNELASAERLEPGLPFAKPAAVQELKSLLTARQSHVGSASFMPSVTASNTTPGGFSWNIIILVLLGVALFAYFINRRTRPAMQPTSTTPSFGGGYSGYSTGTSAYGSGAMPPSSGIGSGILGSLATGAAVGAGVVAGEALMHRVLDGNGQPALSSGVAGTSATAGDWSRIAPAPEPDYDMGGNDFGLNDDTSWDDNGNAGDDWN
ncbi:MAG TPA: tetratricopeptide repeat protein [Oxalicibacterium sp.]|uniref:tetratricopeptide repeat protein n=1 Tax=Oxalicibacterium sp. TaxID=2766525 RepID=UPI002CCFDB9D|nr:tetratricopeptide repeat protein [Oxalicibacterium sp.]HWU98998.1 tetratricopeptide repeat protein [Oxalicibacterium sp.]